MEGKLFHFRGHIEIHYLLIKADFNRTKSTFLIFNYQRGHSIKKRILLKEFSIASIVYSSTIFKKINNNESFHVPEDSQTCSSLPISAPRNFSLARESACFSCMDYLFYLGSEWQTCLEYL